MSGGKAPKTGTNWMDVQKEQEQHGFEKDMQQLQWQRADSLREHEEAQRQQTLEQASAALRGTAYDRLARRGIDARNYGSVIDSAIAGAQTRAQGAKGDLGGYFTDSVIEDAFGKARDDERAKYGAAVTQRWSPGFENAYFRSDADDYFINDVLGRQKQEATSYLDRARSRGQLDDSGYGSALQKIGEMEQTGRSRANALGDAVLQGNRTRLSDIANQAKSAAGAYELGQSFDVGAYGRQFDDTLNSLNTRLGGDVYGALEGQKFFDVGDIIARGGSTMGAANPTTERPDQIAAREKLRTANRGVDAGGGGVF